MGGLGCLNNTLADMQGRLEIRHAGGGTQHLLSHACRRLASDPSGLHACWMALASFTTQDAR